MLQRREYLYISSFFYRYCKCERILTRNSLFTSRAGAMMELLVLSTKRLVKHIYSHMWIMWDCDCVVKLTVAVETRRFRTCRVVSRCMNTTWATSKVNKQVIYAEYYTARIPFRMQLQTQAASGHKTQVMLFVCRYRPWCPIHVVGPHVRQFVSRSRCVCEWYEYFWYALCAAPFNITPRWYVTIVWS